MSLHTVMKFSAPWIESSQEAVLVSDVLASVVFANRAAERMLCAARSELLGPLERGERAAAWTKAAARLVAATLAGESGGPWECELDLGTAQRALAFSATPVRDESEAVVGVVLKVSELSGRRTESHHEEPPRHASPPLALFENMPQLGWVANPDGWIYYYNRRWYEYTGTTPAQMEGWGWQSVHDETLLPEVMERWYACLAAGEPFEMPFTLRRHDGARRWFLTRATPLRDERGSVVGWVGVNTDIHEHREAQERLEALATLAVHLAEARTRAQVTEVIIERGMRSARADICTLYMLDPNRTVLELIGERGCAPEIIEKVRRISEFEENPAAFHAVKSGTALWAESFDDYASLFPSLAHAKVPELRAKAFWSVPLVVEGRAIGLLGMGFYEPRQFSLEERAFVATFTNQCAQALLRAIHLEWEDKAKRALTTTLRSIGDAVIATDTYGLVTFMNPVAEELTGWGEVEAFGQSLAEVFHLVSATGQSVESPVGRVLRDGAGVPLGSCLVSKSGRRIPIDDRGAPIKDESGTVVGVVIVFRDVSDEKAESIRRAFLVDAAGALASSLDYRSTLATVTRLAVPHLADWCTVDLIDPSSGTPQQVAIAHADSEQLALAREMGKRYPPNPHAAHGAPQVIRSGRSELYSDISDALLEARARDAEHLRLLRQLKLESAMVVPLRGRDRTFGAMTFIYAASGRRYTQADLAFAEEFARRAATAIETATSFRDLEEARARERDLREQAEIASRAKDEFLATVSHELRTPLNAILGYAVLLRARKLPEGFERPLSIIERNARSQARLIDDVLDMSRIISGKLSLSIGAMSLADAVEAALDAVGPAADAKGISVQVEIDDRELQIMADHDRIQQVVWNLTSNAVKFTPKGGAISVRVHREGPDIFVRVADTGEGIAAESLARVFDLFHQSDASSTRRHGGLGLGLAIVKQLVGAHGGSVTAHSPGVGRGAEFVVQLPARIVPAPKHSSSPALASGWSIEGDTQAPRLDGLKLLVVDDELDARTLLAEVLSMLGAEVHVAASVDEALLELERVRPDVLVSDIGMPAADGYTLIRSVRTLSADRGGSTPAVALTAYASAADRQRAFAAGYQSHVAKPVEPMMLATIVAKLTERPAEA